MQDYDNDRSHMSHHIIKTMCSVPTQGSLLARLANLWAHMRCDFQSHGHNYGSRMDFRASPYNSWSANKVAKGPRGNSGARVFMFFTL